MILFDFFSCLLYYINHNDLAVHLDWSCRMLYLRNTGTGTQMKTEKGSNSTVAYQSQSSHSSVEEVWTHLSN